VTQESSILIYDSAYFTLSALDQMLNSCDKVLRGSDCGKDVQRFKRSKISEVMRSLRIEFDNRVVTMVNNKRKGNIFYHCIIQTWRGM
jgi:hypothetical protein